MSIKVMTRVWDCSKQKGTRLLAVLALANFCNDESFCWPSTETIAHYIRTTARNAQMALSAIETAGEIYRELNAGRGNTNMTAVLVGLPPREIRQLLAVQFKLDETAIAAILKKVKKTSPFKKVKPGAQKVKFRAEKVKPGAQKVKPASPRTTTNRHRSTTNHPSRKTVAVAVQQLAFPDAETARIFRETIGVGHAPYLDQLSRTVTPELAQIYANWIPTAPKTFTDPVSFIVKRLLANPTALPPKPRPNGHGNADDTARLEALRQR